MKDFDAERKIREDRSFRLCGEEFTFKPSVQQDLIDRYFDSLSDVELKNADVMKIMDDLVIGGLESDSREKWHKIRDVDAPVPVMGDQVHNVIRYMLEVMVNRPIESPSGSGLTQEPTGTSSTDKSPAAVDQL